MKTVTLVFDQEGVNAVFMEADDLETPAKKLVDESYEACWKDEMDRKEFDEEIANQWGFKTFEIKHRFEFNGYDLRIDGKDKWNRQ